MEWVGWDPETDASSAAKQTEQSVRTAERSETSHENLQAYDDFFHHKPPSCSAIPNVFRSSDLLAGVSPRLRPVGCKNNPRGPNKNRSDWSRGSNT